MLQLVSDVVTALEFACQQLNTFSSQSSGPRTGLAVRPSPLTIIEAPGLAVRPSPLTILEVQPFSYVDTIYSQLQFEKAL